MTQYTGTDNLDVMAAAVRYNAFLMRCIATNARAGDRILDFGAGIGTFATQMAQAGHRVVCVEPDPAQAQRLRESGLTVLASIQDIAPGTFDYVYSLNVIEHIQDDRAAVAALAAALKPGGRILLYVPAFQLPHSESMDRKVGHFRRYRCGGLCFAGFVGGIRRCRSARYASTRWGSSPHCSTGSSAIRARSTPDRWSSTITTCSR